MERKEQKPIVFPYRYRPAFNVNGLKIGYWVKVYFLVTYENGNFQSAHFWSVGDVIENKFLCEELGVPCLDHDFDWLVTPDNKWKHVYADIDAYVSETGIDRQY